MNENLKKKKPSCIRATPEVADLISSLQKESYIDKIIKDAIETLKKNMSAGQNVQKKKIPKHYINKYGIHNLYVMNLDLTRRLTYTLIFDGVGVSVNILEIFLDHKQYERRFGYS